MKSELILTVFLVWANALINSINGANESELVSVILSDESKVKSIGDWYIYAIQGDDDSHRRLGCLNIKVFKNGKGNIISEHLYTFDGKPVDVQLLVEWTEHPIAEFTLYEINDDDSKKRKVCNIQRGASTPHRHFFKFTTFQSTCAINPGLNFTVICGSKSKKLNPGDIEDMYKFCPPTNSVYIDRENC